MRQDIMEESSRKRPAPAEPTHALDPAKRQRVVAEPPTLAATVPPLPPGPISYRQLFTIDPENAAANFDVKMFQDPALVQQILIPILQSIDENKLLEATNVRETPVACQYHGKRHAGVEFPWSGVNAVSRDPCFGNGNLHSLSLSDDM